MTTLPQVAPPTTPPRPSLSVAEAAHLLGISEWLLLREIQRGNIPHKRCGRRIVLSRERLLRWLTEDPE